MARTKSSTASQRRRAVALPGTSASARHPASAAQTRDQRLLIGASWYPELWPETEWVRDVERMRELGFTIVRLFEFAWHRFEPRPGEFDVAWALQVMDHCHDAGIAVMIGTPTAAPPAWLTSDHPDVLHTHADGRVATHGQRKHTNHHSATWRRQCRRIVARLAATFADHPALHSWQIDNEMSGFDHGEETRALFQRWLRRRFGTVAAMNRAWGLEFWSQAYDQFEQVPLCSAAVGSVEVPERHHPSLIMAMARFQNEAWTTFIAEQCAEIRKRSAKPITTNMTAGLQMHWFQHNRVLDRVGHSMYADLDHYHWNLAKFDRMRAEKRSKDGSRAAYWLLETAPNWSAAGRLWNIHRHADGVQAMTWLSTLLGGSMTLFWQWREHWAGQEIQHGTVVTATGKWRPNRDALATLAQRFAQHGRWLLAHPPAPARLAIVLSNEAAWGFSIDPIEDGLRYENRWRDDHYLPLALNHWWRDVISIDADFTSYRVLVLPMLAIIPEAARTRLAEWVRAGGRLVLGPLTGHRTEDWTVPTDHEFGGLEELIGGDSALRFPVHWVEDRVRVVIDGVGESATRTWCEAFTPRTGTTVVARYRGGYGDGLPAILRASVGAGEVLTLGCPLDEAAWLALVGGLARAAGLAPVASADGRVVVVPRATSDGRIAGYGVVNLTEETRTVTLPSGGTDLLSGMRVGSELHLGPLQAMVVRM